MTTSVGKNCLSGLLFEFFMNVYQYVCVLLSLLVLRVGCGICVVLISDQCLCIYFDAQLAEFSHTFEIFSVVALHYHIL